MAPAKDPASPVVKAGSLTCPHKGVRALKTVDAGEVRLTVDDSPVVTVSAVGGTAAYAGCTFSDSNGAHACDTTEVTSTGAARLTVGGSNAVLLSTDSVTALNKAVSTGQGAAQIETGQTKLTAT